MEELKTQITELRALVEKNSGGTPTEKSAVGGVDTSQVRLEQNAPNPLSEVTRIGYSLRARVNDAVLTISDMQGRPAKTITGLSSRRQVITLQAGSLP